MSTLKIGVHEGRTHFLPGEEVAGAVLWELDEPPKSAELRMIWFTRGKGTEEAEVVATQSFDHPQPGDTRKFNLKLPAAPYSFSGKLISLIWALELVIKPGKRFERLEITMAPGEHEIILPAGPEPERSKVSLMRGK
ncbi:MAG: hypothetical protein JWL59_902 [Chthoniobacteraceae bacterium]|nr:hypothetical protein [Chthoniobacteraceae bacterium]